MTSMTETDAAARHEQRRAAALAMGGPRKLEKRAEAGPAQRPRARRPALRPRVRSASPACSRPRTSKPTRTSHRPTARSPAPATSTAAGRRSSPTTSPSRAPRAARSATRRCAYMKDLAAQLRHAAGLPRRVHRRPDARHHGRHGDGRAATRSTRFLRKRESPWVSAVFGYAFGSAPGTPSRPTSRCSARARSWPSRAPAWSAARRVRQVDARGARRLEGARRGHRLRRRGGRHRRGGDRAGPPLPRRYLPSHNGEAPPVVAGARRARASAPAELRSDRPGVALAGLRRAQGHRDRRRHRLRLPDQGRIRQEPRDVPGAHRRAQRGHHREQPDVQGRRDRRAGAATRRPASSCCATPTTSRSCSSSTSRASSSAWRPSTTRSPARSSTG